MAISSLTNFVNSVSLEKEDSNAKKNITTRFGLGNGVHGHEGALGIHDHGRDLVSARSAVFGLCAFAPLSLLFCLKGLLHYGGAVVDGHGRCLASGCHKLFLCRVPGDHS